MNSAPEGLSLRDYFAAHVATGLARANVSRRMIEEFSGGILSADEGGPSDLIGSDGIANWAYAIADAMLERRKV